MKILDNKIIQFIFLLVLFLIFLRIDYRFDNTVNCCSDEYDYYSHAATIVFDFDLDYSNQNVRNFSYQKNNKITPIGFFGSGLLSSPFLLIGTLLSNITNDDLTKILNFQILFYSLASVFYFFCSYFLIQNSLKILHIKFNKFFLLLIYSGSGITYFAFERFGMTHVFEVFGLSLLINLVIRFYINLDEKFKIYSFLIPFVMFLCFITRMSNIYIFVIPYLIRNLLLDKKIILTVKLIYTKQFIISSVFSILIYFALSTALYGDLILNAQRIYGTNISASDIYYSESNFLVLISSLLRTVYIVLFSKEFGIFWVSPILFIGCISALTNKKKLLSKTNILLFLCFAQNIFIIHLWQALGSSYGFRYLYSLVPISVMVYYLNYESSKYYKFYLLFFSIFANFSILFFETTEKTQLSTFDQINSFGKQIRYVAPDYIVGLFDSFIHLNSYLIIFTTSFFGVLIFKIIFLFIDQNEFVIYLTNIGLPTNNQDFQNYLQELNEFSFYKLALILLLLSLASFCIVKSNEVKV